MNYLFFLVHPSKYHLFKNVINKLIASGNRVNLLIISKGGLEDLVKYENWNYLNIFPQGRRIKGLNTLLSSGIYAFATIYKLLKYTRNKKYDLYVTDDLLTIVGRIRNVPTIFCTDDDINAVPESFILMSSANYILSPWITFVGRYEKIKIGYYGYKSLAHLHPNQFTPDRQKLSQIFKPEEDYFFIRCVSVTSTHDVGKKGISDLLLLTIVRFLLNYGKVIINSERVLPDELNQYKIEFENGLIAHYLAFAKIFIGDSTTMCAEAAVLGTPAIEIDDWFADFNQYKLFNEKYELIYGFKPDDQENMFAKLNELISDKALEDKCKKNRQELIEDSIDVSSFIFRILSEYPHSVEEYFNGKEKQKNITGRI